MQPHPEVPSPLPAAAETGSQPTSAEQDSTASGIPPGIRRSMAAFRRDLPELLKNKKLFRRWVAYHGDERIGFACSSFDLYEECARRGLKDEEFAVCWIFPEIPEDEETMSF
jgi:hypothetical protein